MKVKIRYFASLREKAGMSQEELELPKDHNLTKLYHELTSRYHFELSVQEIKFSVNSEYVPADYVLKANDVIAFIPPVAGG